MPVNRPARRQIFVALGAILNDKNEVLLGRRHDPKNRGMHDRWEFPGGKVEFGEHPIETVIREAQEEVGVQVAVDKILNTYSWFHPDRPHIQVVLIAYIARIVDGKQPFPNCSEVVEVAWMPIDDALKANIIQNNSTILNDLKKAL